MLRYIAMEPISKVQIRSITKSTTIGVNGDFFAGIRMKKLMEERQYGIGKSGRVKYQ